MAREDNEAHHPDQYVGGVEIVGNWVGDFEVTTEELFHYCENEVDNTQMWDLCMRMVVTIEEYQSWWKRCRASVGDDDDED